MSNERPNEFLPWRGKLTPPDALPEKGLDDREQSWQRLAERLQKRPRRRGTAWWIAAACLIFAFFPATVFFRSRPAYPSHIALRPPALRPPALRPFARREPATQSQPATQPRPVATSQAQPASATRPAPSTSRRIAPATHSHPAPPSNSNYGEIATITSPATTAAVTAASAASPTANPTFVAITDPIGTATPAPPHRRLRLVYLNELNKDPGPSATSTREPATLHLGFATTTTDWTTSQQNTSIIKIGISSHNH